MTFVKVSGQEKFLYRAIDKGGHTIDFLLTARRDQKVAMRFLKRAVKLHGTPKDINIDMSEANASANKALGHDRHSTIKMRQNKYLNDIVEEDHRGMKGLTTLMKAFKIFQTAQIPVVASTPCG